MTALGFNKDDPKDWKYSPQLASDVDQIDATGRLRPSLPLVRLTTSTYHALIPRWTPSFCTWRVLKDSRAAQSLSHMWLLGLA